jgi:hypothetical protein
VMNGGKCERMLLDMFGIFTLNHAALPWRDSRHASPSFVVLTGYYSASTLHTEISWCANLLPRFDLTCVPAWRKTVENWKKK